MTDDTTPTEANVRGWLVADAIDCLQEWMKRTGHAEDAMGSCRVRWTADGNAEVETPDGDLFVYRLTVLVEPAERWDLMSWEDLATWPEPWAGPLRVRLNGVEATLVSAVLQDWHVDPRSSEYRPIPLDHNVVAVKLIVGDAEEKMYRMPPSGQVEVHSGSLGEAVAAILHAFPGTTPVPPTLSES
jgi:hypothetical protein